jgi:hypothetical protein
MTHVFIRITAYCNGLIETNPLLMDDGCARIVTLNLYKCILIHVQQDATLHSLFYVETAPHVSGGTSTQHQERKQLYLQHLVFVRPLLISAAIVEELELV